MQITTYEQSLFALEMVGEDLAFGNRKVSEEDNVGLVFFRAKENGAKFLKATTEEKMTWWQRIKRFFGTKDFSQKVIAHLAHKTLKRFDKKLKFSGVGVSVETIKNVVSSVDLINKRVDAYNAGSWKRFLSKIFGIKEAVTKVDTSAMSDLIASLPKEAESDPLKGRVKYIPPKQEPPSTVPPPVIIPLKAPVDELVKVVSKPPRGIENPSCLCYCNSTIQLIAQDPELRASIWKDENSDTENAIKVLQEVIQDLKQQSPVFDGEKGKTLLRFCPGLTNAFVNTKIKILLEDIPKEIEKLQNQKKVRESLLLVLGELDKGGRESLSHDEEPLKSFNKAMQGLFPGLRDRGIQRDQQEFFLPLLEAIRSPEGRQKGLAFTIQNERDVFEKTVGETPGGTSAECVKKILQSDMDSLRKLKCVYALITIPTVRPVEESQEEPIVLIHPEADVPRQHVKNHFYDMKLENVELDGILGNDKNQPLLAEVPELKPFLESMVDKESKKLPPVWRSQTWFIKGEPKKCLPVYIARFADVNRKNQNKVVCDAILKLPIEGKDAYASYEIKSITCHSGSGSLQGGHYFHYRPENGSPRDEKGMPTNWIRISDSSVRHVAWKDIAETVYSEAVFYDYNLI